MNTFKRIAAVFGLMLLITILMAAVKLPEVEVKRQKVDYEVQNPEERILKHEAQFLADKKLVESDPFFRGSKGESDAGPYLNPMLAKLAIPKEIQKELQNRNWVQYKPDFKKLMLDFSWMKELAKYDYWAPDLNNPEIDPKSHPNITMLPLPEYSHLISWARLRLKQGKLTNDMKNAQAEVRHLARLIYTNDYLVSSMVAITILKSESMFLQKERSEVVEAARRYLWGVAEIVDPRVSDETYGRLTEGNVGKCQMITEGALRNLIVRDELQNMYPNDIKRFDETVKNSLKYCRKSLVHMMWEDPQWKFLPVKVDYAESFVKPENESNWKWNFLMILPRMREIYAFQLLSNVAPNYFRQYEEMGRAHEEK
jgi:hypothetical protein